LEYLFDVTRYSVSRQSDNLAVEIHEDVNQLRVLDDTKRSVTAGYPKSYLHSQLVGRVGRSLSEGRD